MNLVRQPETGSGRSSDIAGRLSSHRQQEQELLWKGNFGQYFDMVVENPRIARLSHGLVYDMIRDSGVANQDDGKVTYNFFENDLFGLPKVKDEVVTYFASASQRLETRKRILMLMGPVGGGKSTLVESLKRGLESYTRTPQGSIYGIEGCPMNEEPLHLIPNELRPSIRAEYGIHIEGDLCPHCRVMVKDKYSNIAENVDVQRIIFSEKERVGIGTFAPSDPKSQDISELTGSMDLATIGQYGAESDPRAYRFDGELNKANRGMMEFIEMLKADPKFLYSLLTLTQEQNIKTGRYGMIYGDEVVVAHTNQSEYEKFKAQKDNQAFMDRMYVIRVPYNLRYSDEERIYKKLIADKSGLEGVHIAPHSLKIPAMFAVLTRLAPTTKAGVDLVKKMNIYNGDRVEGQTDSDLKELQEEHAARVEGMEGISPRFITDALSIKAVSEGLKCLTPINSIRSLRDLIESRNPDNEEKRKDLLDKLDEARKQYDNRFAKVEVQRAFVYAFEEQARDLLDNYLSNAEASINHTKVKDPVTEEEMLPDEKLMRSLEDQIGVSEAGKGKFREGILVRVGTLAWRGKKFSVDSHPQLREAVEKRLFEDLKNVIKITTGTRTPDVEQSRRIAEVQGVLENDHGYCGHCSQELVRYVGAMLNR